MLLLIIQKEQKTLSADTVPLSAVPRSEKGWLNERGKIRYCPSYTIKGDRNHLAPDLTAHTGTRQVTCRKKRKRKKEQTESQDILHWKRPIKIESNSWVHRTNQNSNHFFKVLSRHSLSSCGSGLWLPPWGACSGS